MRKELQKHQTKTSKPPLVFFSQFYVTTDYGGAARYIFELIERLKNKYNIYIITAGVKKHKNIKNLKITKYKGTTIVYYPSITLAKNRVYLPTLPAFKDTTDYIQNIYTNFCNNKFYKKPNKEHNSYKFTLVFNNRFYPQHPILHRLLKRKLKNIKTILLTHGDKYWLAEPWYIKIASIINENTLGKYIVKNSNIVVSAGKSYKEYLKTLGAKDYIVIPNTTSIKPKAKKIPKKPPKVVKIIYIGRLYKHKGAYELVQAIRFLKDYYPIQLTIIGSGPLEDRLQNFVHQYNLEKVIKLHRAIPHSKVPSMLDKHHIFTLYSKIEGLPTTILEAIFRDLVIASSDAGGTSGIIDEKYLLNSQNITPATVYKHLKNVLDNYLELAKYYHTLHKKVVREYTWEKNAKKFEELVTQ